MALTAYIAVGLILVFVGPAADELRAERASLRNDQRPEWKIAAFSLALALGVLLLWPILLTSAAKQKRKRERRENIGELFRAIGAMSAAGPDADALPTGYGDFGLEPTNPIPCRTVLGSQNYLERLRTSEGGRVKFVRKASILTEISEKPIDAYDVSDLSGAHIATIYVSPYHRQNSSRAPRGFAINLGEDASVVHTRSGAETPGSPPQDNRVANAEVPSIPQTAAHLDSAVNAEPSITDPSNPNSGDRASDVEIFDELFARARAGEAEAQFRVGSLYEAGVNTNGLHF